MHINMDKHILNVYATYICIHNIYMYILIYTSEHIYA